MLKLMLQLFGDDPDGGLSLGSLLNEAAGGDPEEIGRASCRERV